MEFFPPSLHSSHPCCLYERSIIAIITGRIYILSLLPSISIISVFTCYFEICVVEQLIQHPAITVAF